MHAAWAFAIFTLLLLGYAAFTTRLSESVLSPAILFTAAGILLGPLVLGLIDIELESESVKVLAEVTLALALFADAARIDLGSLRSQLGIPVRLLSIGLPLTIAAGFAVAAIVFPDMLLVEVALIAIILAPTDAALGQRVVTDPAVPVPVRQGLNVESGLNDGIAVPFYLLAIEVARAEVTGRPVAQFLGLALEQIGLGLVAGLVGGLVGGVIIRVAEGSHRIENSWRQIVMFAAAGLAYAVSVALGGSVFVATFAGGMAFAAVSRRSSLDLAHFTEQAQAILSALTFLAFGFGAVAFLVPRLSWAVVFYALASLTVVRMVPVAFALLGSQSRGPTVAFIGWFGPRGLASIVFGLGLLEVDLPHQATVVAVIFATVLLSVVAHGLSAPGLTRAYSGWFSALDGSGLAEDRAVHEDRVRLGPGL